jgi:hypothetical protein
LLHRLSAPSRTWLTKLSVGFATSLTNLRYNLTRSSCRCRRSIRCRYSREYDSDCDRVPPG